MSQRLAQILASAIGGGGLPVTPGASGTILTSNGTDAVWTTPAPSVAWVPTFTASGGTFTSVTSDIRSMRFGSIVVLTGKYTIVNAGTATGATLMTLPYAAARPSVGAAAEVATTGDSCRVRVDPAVLGASSSSILRYNNTAVITTGYVVEFGLTYEAA